MKRVSKVMCIRNLVLGTVAAGLIGLAGCDRGEVVAYDIPKETPPGQFVPPDSLQADPHAGMPMSRPSVKWGELPDGWTLGSQGSGMRLATFNISAEGGQSAEMAIIPMVGFSGSEAQLVNMWRMQLGLPELPPTSTEEQGEPVTIGGIEGRLHEMTGTTQGVATRILVASAEKDGVSFFFKLIGHDALVQEQKDILLGFLSGVEFTEAEQTVSHPQVTTSSVPASGQRWVAPEGWEELPATQFLLAKYRIAGGEGASAEVTISMLGGNAGGLLPNVNRWRGQLNLAPVDEAGLEALLSDIKAGTVDAKLVTLEGTDLRSGTPARMLTVVVPLPTETWFFKMTGAIAVVDAKADEFRAFVNSTSF